MIGSAPIGKTPIGSNPAATTIEHATAALTLPMLGLTSSATDQTFRANVAAVLPTITVYGVAHDSTGERAADLVLPALTLVSNGGANADLALPKITGSSSGTVTILASSALTLPALTLTSSVTVASTASVQARLPSLEMSSYSGAVCSVTVGGLTIQATGTTGSVGRANVTLPLFELNATAVLQATASANLTLPSLGLAPTAQAQLSLPTLKLTSIGSAVVTATFEAYATNLKHNPRGNEQPVDEVTHYTNFPFTHVVRYQNSYYGANSTGLYLLEGTTDDATPIPWNWKTATTDFKSPQNKTVASAYFGGRLGPADTITLHAGEGAKVQTYSYTTPRGALAQNYRQVFGKGIKSHRYYTLEASGTGELALDDISLDVHNLSRRI